MPFNQKISYSLIIVVFLAFIGGGWYFYQQLFKNIKNPLTVIPESAVAVLEIEDFSRMESSLKSSEKARNALSNWPGLDTLASILPEILNYSTSLPDQEKSLIISWHPKGLLLLGSSELFQLEKQQQENLGYSIHEKTFRQNYFWEIEKDNKRIFVHQKRGLLALSTNELLLDEYISQFNDKKLFLESDDFEKLKKVSGKRADAHFFVRFDSLSGFIDAVNSSVIWQHPDQIANWGGLDLMLKENELMLNGYIRLNTESNQFLKILQDQESQGMNMASLFPYETRSFSHISISDYKKYYQNWQNYLAEVGEEDQSGKYKAAFGDSPVDEHNEWWTGEMAQLSTKNNQEYAVFMAKKGREAFKSLSNFAHLSQPGILMQEYHDYKIKELNFPNVLYQHFGPWFFKSKKYYFTVVQELVIFSNSIENLKDYIDGLERGYVLEKNETYSVFSDNLSKNLSYTFYLENPRKSIELFDFISTEYAKAIDQTSLFKKDLNAFSLQLNWKNNMVYTGIFAELEGKKAKRKSEWQILLESEIVKGPFLIHDHTDDSHKYIVFDAYRQMYLINDQGDVVWKKQLEESPISEVTEIDYYKNGKIQYLFNSENYLYLVDLTGKYVADYPVKLNDEAVCGLSLIDYNDDKDYRILIAAENGQIYNYTKEVSLLKDWKPKNTNKKIVKPVYRVIAGGKDYLVAEGEESDVIMFDRKGKVRMEIRKSFENALGSDFYANKTNSKGILITTDQNGKLIYIPEKGKIQQSDFGDYSKDHYFLYDDFSGNGNMDFIYLDQNKLIVFDRFKEKLIQYVFQHTISQKPVLQKLNSKVVLLVLDETKKELYLFDRNGLFQSKANITSHYLIDHINRDYFIIAADGKKLAKYPIMIQ